jgi:hydrogenase maturation protease
VPEADARVVVIGVGVAERGDDGAGPAVARQVRALLDRRGVPPSRGIRVLECRGEASDLIAAWDGVPAVILIDAVRSGDPPGHIHRIDVNREPTPWRGAAASTHAFGVAEAVALARALGRLPRRLILYGIVGETFALGSGLSAAVAAAIPSAAGLVLEELSAWL